jgi:nitroreductase
MELFEGLLSRRSIRNYTGAKISESEIIDIIKAGMYAPSANNKRPWHFIIVDDREVMLKIMSFHPYAKMLEKASHAILVCGDETLQNAEKYYMLDCSTAAQNILLASHAKGYGAVWIAVEPRIERKNAAREIFGLPDHIQPVAIISIGVPVSVPDKIPDRFEAEKIRKNHW